GDQPGVFTDRIQREPRPRGGLAETGMAAHPFVVRAAPLERAVDEEQMASGGPGRRGRRRAHVQAASSAGPPGRVGAGGGSVTSITTAVRLSWPEFSSASSTTRTAAGWCRRAADG